MSKSIYQLQNHDSYTEKKAKEDCIPIVYLSDIEGVFNATTRAKMDAYVKSKSLTYDDVLANPCGLVAKTFFNGELL
jgi:hypothetical protein